MSVSPAVRRWYAERLFAPAGRGEVPPAFRPLDRAPTGRAVVEGCRGGGKNVLEVRLVVEAARVAAVSMSCNLCNPAMLVAADLVGRWLPGREAAAVLALAPAAEATLDPFFALLEAPERPADAAEKLRYVLAAVQNALRDDRGLAPLPIPEFEAAAAEDES